MNRAMTKIICIVYTKKGMQTISHDRNLNDIVENIIKLSKGFFNAHSHSHIFFVEAKFHRGYIKKLQSGSYISGFDWLKKDHYKLWISFIWFWFVVILCKNVCLAIESLNRIIDTYCSKTIFHTSMIRDFRWIKDEVSFEHISWSLSYSSLVSKNFRASIIKKRHKNC